MKEVVATILAPKPKQLNMSRVDLGHLDVVMTTQTHSASRKKCFPFLSQLWQALEYS